MNARIQIFHLYSVRQLGQPHRAKARQVGNNYKNAHNKVRSSIKQGGAAGAIFIAARSYG